MAAGLNDLAILLSETGDYAEARELFERALAINETALGKDHPRLAENLTNIGILHRRTSDLEAAQAALERALRIHERAFGPDHPKVAYSLSHLIDVLLDTAGVATGTYFGYVTNLDHLANHGEDFGGMMTEIEIINPGP